MTATRVEHESLPHDYSTELREWGSRVAVANGLAPRTGSVCQEISIASARPDSVG